MIKQLFKIIWNQRRINAWIFIELLIVTAAMWTMIDHFWVVYRTYQQPLGFKIDKTWSVKITSYGEGSEEYVSDSITGASRLEDLYSMMAQLKRLPMVENIAVSYYSCPYSRGNTWRSILPLEGDTSRRNNSIQVRYVTPDYFDLFRIHDLNGQSITDQLQKQRAVAVLTSEAKNEFYPDSEAVGKKIMINAGNGEEFRIVAVCTSIKYTEYERPESSVYQVMSEDMLNSWVNSYGLESAELSLRVKADYTPEALMASIREAGGIRSNNMYVYATEPFDALRERRIRFFEDESKEKAGIMFFILINVFFGVVGTFWLYTQNAQSEIGLRMAIGSTRQSIRRFIFLQGLLLLALTVIPVLLYALNMIYLEKIETYRMAITFGRFLITFGATYLVMAVIIYIGIWYPSHKAMQIQPAEILHYE